LGFWRFSARGLASAMFRLRVASEMVAPAPQASGTDAINGTSAPPRD
jgi:hypothetical protein